MQSIIIVSTDATQSALFIENWCNSYHIHLLDVSRIQIEGTIGIEEMKNLQKQLFLKPIRGDKKVIIVHNAQTMTIEAQNAFLKTLEEPPVGTYLLLLTTSIEAFLPTILSRCKVITLSQRKITITPEEREQLKEYFAIIFSQSMADKLSLAQKIGENKDISLLWVEKAILSLRENLLQAESEQAGVLINTLEQFQKTYKTIKTTNVSPRFVLENLFLGL